MPQLGLGKTLPRESAPRRELILQYLSDFSSSLDSWTVTTAKTFAITGASSVGGEDDALRIEASVDQTTALGNIQRNMGSDFDQYDTLGYSFEYSLRYYRTGGNPFSLSLRLGTASQNNTSLFGLDPSGVTGAWTTLSGSGSFGTMTGDLMSFAINSLTLASGHILYLKDIQFRVYA